MRTEAIIFPEADRITFGAVELPEPQPGDLLVRTTVSLVSTGTETRVLHGGQDGAAFPLVPGYSSLGVVEKTFGDTGGVAAGDLVDYGSPRELIGCHRVWGGHARHAVVAARSVHPLDERRSPAEYAFATVASVAVHGVRRTFSEPGDGVLVVGQGLIGQLHARVQVALGRQVAVVDILPWRLERSLAGGVARAINAREEDPAAAVHALWPQGPQVAVEATARPEGLRLCEELLRGRAWGGDDRMPVLAIQSSFVGRIDVDANTFFMKEYILISPRSVDPRDHAAALSMIGAGALPVADLITLRADPRQAAGAYDQLLKHPERHLTCVFEWE
jgi:2-desacetyl-2-hydroxyethyl bacteriochlorophyllide A dehydrogenase